MTTSYALRQCEEASRLDTKRAAIPARPIKMGIEIVNKAVAVRPVFFLFCFFFSGLSRFRTRDLVVSAPRACHMVARRLAQALHRSRSTGHVIPAPVSLRSGLCACDCIYSVSYHFAQLPFCAKHVQMVCAPFRRRIYSCPPSLLALISTSWSYGLGKPCSHYLYLY